jgi:hypothetical protein
MQHQSEVQATVNANGVSAGLVDHVRDGNQLLAQGLGRILLGIATAADGDGTPGKGGVPGAPGRSSGYTTPTCLGELREIKESKPRTGIAALRRMAIRQVRLERLALSASGYERVFNGWAAASR